MNFPIRLKKKGFKEERVTTVRLDDLGKTTTLESNKSQLTLFSDDLKRLRSMPSESPGLHLRLQSIASRGGPEGNSDVRRQRPRPGHVGQSFRQGDQRLAIMDDLAGNLAFDRR